METKIRRKIVALLDNFFEDSADINFKNLTDDGDDCTQEEGDEIEAIFMSYRNVIAGTDWDGELREYEKYEVRK